MLFSHAIGLDIPFWANEKKKNQTRLQNQVAYDVIYLNMHDIVNTLYK